MTQTTFLMNIKRSPLMSLVKREFKPHFEPRFEPGFKQRSYLSLSILLGLTILTTTAQADTTGSEDFRTPSSAVDINAPIAALSTLTSVADAKPLKVTVPTIQPFKTKSGVPVLFVRTTALPIVDIDLRFNAGSARDGSIRKAGFGIANMTATMLNKALKA